MSLSEVHWEMAPRNRDANHKKMGDPHDLANVLGGVPCYPCLLDGYGSQFWLFTVAIQ